MQHDLVISGGTIATASETFSADIGIRDGQIVTTADICCNGGLVCRPPAADRETLLQR